MVGDFFQHALKARLVDQRVRFAAPTSFASAAGADADAIEPTPVPQDEAATVPAAPDGESPPPPPQPEPADVQTGSEAAVEVVPTNPQLNAPPSGVLSAPLR